MVRVKVQPLVTPESQVPPTRVASPEDAELLARARGGDGEAFGELVTRHRNMIWRLLLRMLHSEEEAAEIMQDAFLQAFEKLPEFRGDAAFSSWLYRIAANAALMRLRRKRRSPEVESTENLLEQKFDDSGHWAGNPPVDWSEQADARLMDKELGKAIEEAVANLPDEYRVVFLMKDVDGLSNEEIADALGLSVPAAKSRLHRARLALRDKLSEFFGGG
jgi:RNA polymerase sigma-70 factor (ECF subfamily)